uniref:Uncharacterized protein n=1 Tax=Oryza nivara TaxID=4536 RepID=A0A0E0HZY6_ORYNI
MTEGSEQRRRLLLGYLGRHMNTPMAAVFSILSITTHHHVMATGGEHLHWFSMARFGCPRSSVYHNMPSHHGS